MSQRVQGADGRAWTVRSEMSWTKPVTADDFEHDVAGGSTPIIVMGLVLALLIVVLIAWMPAGVFVPSWLILILLLVVLFFPVHWALRRPWTVVAETEGNLGDRPAEKWVGTMRGMNNVRQQRKALAKDIEVYAEPDIGGPLRPVE
ncbi:MAG: DUF983 domain-containing protein [Sciscionella sp.]